MNLKVNITKNKYLSVLIICCLALFCFLIANRSIKNILDNPTPLSSVNIEAMFYMQDENTGNMTCVGDGLISTTEETSGEESVASAIVSAPDVSAFYGKSQVVAWNSIRHGDEGYRVYGALTSNVVSRNMSINVCDYGMIGDGKFDNSEIFNKLIKSKNSLYFPSGHYLFKSPITISNKLSLYGDSQDTSILLFDTISNHTNWNFRVKTDNFTASNIGFELNKTGQYANKQNIGSTLVKIDTSNNCTFRFCKMTCDDSTPYYYNTLWINSDNGPVSNVTIDNCTIQNTANNKVGGALWIYACKYPINDVSVINSRLFHTGWDENLAIWSGNNIDLKNISVSNCAITNSNSSISSDNIIAITPKSNTSNIKLTNNTIIGDGLIKTGIKLLGLGTINFSSNNVSITNYIDSASTYGNLLVLDSPLLQFNNNIITVSQAFPARLRINNIQKFYSNDLDITAKSFRFEDENASIRTDSIVLEDNNLSLTVNILDICSSLVFEGGSITFNKSTDIYLPSEHAEATINNCTMNGNANIKFDNNYNNTFQITDSSISNQLMTNQQTRLLIK